MSFSQDVKTELVKHFTKSARANTAEAGAIVMLSPESISFDSATRKFVFNDFTTNRKAFNITEDSLMGNPCERKLKGADERRAFLRGAFICSGTVSDPEKGYHLEISAGDEAAASYVQSIMESFGIGAKIVSRRQRFVVYIKESEDISDMLNVMEAHVSLMRFENIRIEKDIRSSVNRQVNCDRANINKTLTAAGRQIEDIELVMSKGENSNLTDALRNICLARLSYPDATLEELGSYVSPPISKSAVNHRLRKISEMADRIRNEV